MPSLSVPILETVDQAVVRAEQAIARRDLSEAKSICMAILAASAEHPVALAFLGYIATQEGDAQQGVILLRRATQLRPGNAHWYTHLSLAYRRDFRMQEALEAGEECIRLNPNDPQHLINLAHVYIEMDRREPALNCLLRALSLKPDFSDGHLLLSEYLLSQGEFDPGWIEYEWRAGAFTGGISVSGTTAPRWNGMRIPNGRLLLACDQGYGDTLQFARYIPMAAERCQELVLACRSEMAPLLEGIPGVSSLCLMHGDVLRLGDAPPHASWALLASLPYLFRTQLDTIPCKIPYLKAKPIRVEYWRERLAATLPKGVKRVGLAWTGKPTHVNDWRRSMPLSSLAPLVNAGSAAFVSLQKPIPERDRAAMASFPGMTDLSNELIDFSETAALMENLDLVITVDTSMSHLAGALGKPVWILIPKAPDWRWLLNRDDSPWYPSARLFRQQRFGSWDEPRAALMRALREVLATP